MRKLVFTFVFLFGNYGLSEGRIEPRLDTYGLKPPPSADESQYVDLATAAIPSEKFLRRMVMDTPEGTLFCLQVDRIGTVPKDVRMIFLVGDKVYFDRLPKEHVGDSSLLEFTLPQPIVGILLRSDRRDSDQLEGTLVHDHYNKLFCYQSSGRRSKQTLQPEDEFWKPLLAPDYGKIVVFDGQFPTIHGNGTMIVNSKSVEKILLFGQGCQVLTEPDTIGLPSVAPVFAGSSNIQFYPSRNFRFELTKDKSQTTYFWVNEKMATLKTLSEAGKHFLRIVAPTF